MTDSKLDIIIDDIDEHEGRGTWFVSLYLRPDTSIQNAREWMLSEYAEADSIKSDNTRKKVQTSLKIVQNILKDIDSMPDNGLALFSSPNHSYIVSDSLPNPISSTNYYCGKEFDTEQLKEISSTGENYGIIIVEKGGAVFGIYNNGSVTELCSKESNVMGKTKAGGQSQARFERERERQKHEFFKEVGERAKNLFLGRNIAGLLIGGTSHTVDEFMDGTYLDYRLYDSVLDTYNIEYPNKQGLKSIVEKAEREIKDTEIQKEKELINKFFNGLPDSVEYGEDNVKKAISYGAVEIVLLSQELGMEEIEKYEGLAGERGSEVEVISSTFDEGKKFYKVFDGVGALMRYEINT